MSNIFSRFKRSLAISLTTAVMVGAIAGVQMVQTAKADAAACDNVNIIYCGLDGNSHAEFVQPLKRILNRGSDNGHNDLKAVYHWAGADNNDMDTLNTNNTKMGTLYRNGEVKVDGKVVGTEAWVTARFTEGAGFVQVKDGVWARKTTTSFANDSVRALVHYDEKGQVDFVVMVDCGNVVKVKPVPPAPKPVLKCDLLSVSKTSALRSYTFTAKASADNTKIVSYVFDFGDGKSTTVRTNAGSVTTTHTYPEDNKSYKSVVVVNGQDLTNVTSPDCTKTIVTPQAEAKPSLVCDSLVYGTVPGQDLAYKFVARATAKQTKITDYVFTFSDGTTKTVKTDADKAVLEHKFAENNQKYTVSVVVNSVDIKDRTSAACKVSLTTPKVEECKPGVPKGSPLCNECKPGIPEGSEECVEAPVVVTPEAPAELVNTGPGALVGLFAGTSALGAIGHRLVTRRLNRD